MKHEFESREAASKAAAERITDALHRRLDGQKDTSLVVSGGTTPAAALKRLSSAKLDWERVHVILSDERWVAPEHKDSNERMVREMLLQGNAAAANLLPVYSAESDIGARCAELDERIRIAALPFACSLLGMGADGHFASLFPDADNLEDGLDVDSMSLCLPVSTAASPHPRVSLTLSALSRSDEVLLLIFGEEKLAVYEKAVKSRDTYPVARLLLQKRAPVNVYWAP